MAAKESGSERALVVSAFETFSRASAQLEAAYRELTERFRALSRELEETNRRLTATVEEKERIGRHLRAVLESLESGVLVADAEGRLTHWNEAAARLLLDEPGRMRTLATLDDVRRARPELDAALDEDGPSQLEATTTSTDGTERCLEVERHRLQDDGGGAVFVVRDRTSLRRLERQTQRMERLAAMGEMALELAHEVRNPLGGIRLHVSVLDDEPLSEGGRRSLEQLRIGVGSLETVVSNMLSFGRPAEPERRDVELGALVREVRDFLEPLTRERGARVDVRLPEAGCRAAVDPAQVRQVLMNLWLNALNAMPRGGSIRVGGGVRDGAVVVEIADDGPGIEPELLGRVFDPFFTTDRKGTGLGLAVASLIVRRHGGTIDVESAPGRGTTFRIRFPSEREVLCAAAS